MTCNMMTRSHSTINKKKIQEILASSHLLSAPEILRKYPEMEESTLYRNLKKMLDCGSIRTVVIGSNIYYEKIADNHHHLVCSVCHVVWPVHFDLKRPKKMSGLRVSIKDIDLMIRVICESCA